MSMPLALTFMMVSLGLCLLRQKIFEQRNERFRTLRRHEMAGLDQLEASAGNLLRKVGAAGVWAYGVVAAGDHHGGAADQWQHVQHVGARQRAEAKAESHRIVAQIAAAIGVVFGGIAEIFW